MYTDEKNMNAIVCVVSDALRPELIDSMQQNMVRFSADIFAPEYLAKKRTKQYTPIGNKGVKSIPTVPLNNKVMLPQVIVARQGYARRNWDIICMPLGYIIIITLSVWGDHGYQSTLQNFISQLDRRTILIWWSWNTSIVRVIPGVRWNIYMKRNGLEHWVMAVLVTATIILKSCICVG